MSKSAEDILEGMRNTKNGWKTRDFETLYLGFGFIKKGKNHDIYIHPKYSTIRDTISRSSKALPPGYATDAVKNIDLLRRLEMEDAHNE